MMTGLINVGLKIAMLGIKDNAIGYIRSVSDIHSKPKVKMVKFGIIVAFAIIGMAMGQEKCGVCMKDSRASCETETTYMMCVGKK